MFNRWSCVLAILSLFFFSGNGLSCNEMLLRELSNTTPEDTIYYLCGCLIFNISEDNLLDLLSADTIIILNQQLKEDDILLSEYLNKIRLNCDSKEEKAVMGDIVASENDANLQKAFKSYVVFLCGENRNDSKIIISLKKSIDKYYIVSKDPISLLNDIASILNECTICHRKYPNEKVENYKIIDDYTVIEEQENEKRDNN